jgi:hypothetical protein
MGERKAGRHNRRENLTGTTTENPDQKKKEPQENIFKSLNKVLGKRPAADQPKPGYGHFGGEPADPFNSRYWLSIPPPQPGSLSLHWPTTTSRPPAGSAPTRPGSTTRPGSCPRLSMPRPKPSASLSLSPSKNATWTRYAPNKVSGPTKTPSPTGTR